MADRTLHHERENFGKLREVIPPPDLIELQISSYLEFLQKETPEKQRKPVGLEAVFREVFPITSYDERLTLEYVSYTIGDPKSSEIECLREGTTYAVPLYVKLRLREEDFIKDEEIFMGDIPMVTERGSFIINGAERVVVSQLHRSPGICFEVATHPNGKLLHSFRIIPDRGTWLEVQFDNNDLLYVYLDRRRRRRKFLITTLLRSIGFSNDLDILNLFYEVQDLKVTKALDMENVSTLVLVEDVIDAQKGVVLARAFEPLTKQIVRTFEKHDIKSMRVIDTTADEGALIRALKKDPTRNEEEA
ncbi:MAG TPA: DNA-directed RNA polymerase subunit beta, partial [Candidatus Didemnitutus sp.]